MTMSDSVPLVESGFGSIILFIRFPVTSQAPLTEKITKVILNQPNQQWTGKRKSTVYLTCIHSSIATKFLGDSILNE